MSTIPEWFYKARMPGQDRHKLTRKNFRSLLDKYYVWMHDERMIDVEMEIDGQVMPVRGMRCYYCGRASSGSDHVPPLAVLRDKLLAYEDLTGIEFIVVPACWECNARLGAKPLLTLRTRKAYLKKQWQPTLPTPKAAEEKALSLGAEIAQWEKALRFTTEGSDAYMTTLAQVERLRALL